LNNQSSCLIKSNYAESIKALGEAGKNLGGSPTPIVFEGGQYSIRDSWGSIPPLVWESPSPTSFKGVFFGSDSGSGRDVYNIVCWGPQGGASFEQCTFSG